MRHTFMFFVAILGLFCCAPLRAQNSVPSIPFTSVPHFLKIPPKYALGEVAGVATNSKGDIFVFTRRGTLAYTVGGSRQFATGAAARLYEFDPNGYFLRQIGKGLYAMAYANAVRVDAHDNIWIVDEGSNMVVEFNPDGSKVLRVLGRKPESLADIPPPAPRGKATPKGLFGKGFDRGLFAMFNRPTDVAWNKAGDIFVADGHGNARVVELDKYGNLFKSWGKRGRGPGQFEDVSSIQVDNEGNVYVGDGALKRIQVFSSNGRLERTITGIGSPWAICITPGPHQYLYSSNSSGPASMKDGEIYKLDLDGKILGKFGHAGKKLGQFMAVHEIDCRQPNVLFVGGLTNWRVQKLILHPKP